MHSVRRFCFLWLIAVLSPLWLGPMLLPIERAIAEAHHVCACGMAVGTCGCPECERLEEARHEEASSPVPVFKGECDRGAPVLGATALPPALLPAEVSVRAATFVALLEPAPHAQLSSRAPPPPPLPPPVLA